MKSKRADSERIRLSALIYIFLQFNCLTHYERTQATQHDIARQVILFNDVCCMVALRVPMPSHSIVVRFADLHLAEHLPPSMSYYKCTYTLAQAVLLWSVVCLLLLPFRFLMRKVHLFRHLFFLQTLLTDPHILRMELHVPMEFAPFHHHMPVTICLLPWFAAGLILADNCQFFDLKKLLAQSIVCLSSASLLASSRSKTSPSTVVRALNHSDRKNLSHSFFVLNALTYSLLFLSHENVFIVLTAPM